MHRSYRSVSTLQTQYCIFTINFTFTQIQFQDLPMKKIIALYLVLIHFNYCSLFAQKSNLVLKQPQCATMDRLEANFKQDPSLKKKFENQMQTFNKIADTRAAILKSLNNTSKELGTTATYVIPIVFHIALADQSLVTDAQIMAQIDVLNKTYAGTNADATGLPSYFKPIFGNSKIQFCLAQRTPDDEITNGIDRITTTKTSFSHNDDGVKYSISGGTEIWNGDKYFNVWVCSLADNLLGYATFPNDGKPYEQGVVIEYRSLPGGSLGNYNGGKTLTHETGHYFNLFHIWGDDDGACTGTDYVDDTPNQGNSSTGCYSGIKTDNCTTGGNGILYQDYMDYSFDKCLVLFTSLQDVRMEAALLNYRSSLTASDGCTPIILKPLDAQLKTILTPKQRICSSNFAPTVVLRNMGLQTLSSVIISTVIDNGTPINYNWNGTLTSLASTNVTLTSLNFTQGNHNIKIYVSSPNAGADQNNKNDTLKTTVQYYDAIATIKEGFEANTFPPQAFDIVNPDKGITWKQTSGIAKTGNKSAMIDNFNNLNIGQQDYLRLPDMNLVGIDSAYFSFQVAASSYTPTTTAGNNWDTLEVLISKDCGISYTSLYKKWGATLVTSAAEHTNEFVPLPTEWRKDSINITSYINSGKFLLAFKNTTGNENNIYLDDINLRTQTINPNLKASGFLVTPNPTKGNITVQFYPNPINLISIQLYNLLGQKLLEKQIASGTGIPIYNFDISNYSGGTYLVKAIFTNKIITKKIIKN